MRGVLITCTGCTSILGFPTWSLVHDRRGRFFVILVIIVLLHSFATHFFSPPPVFLRRWRSFADNFGSNAWFLPVVKTPPPWLSWFCQGQPSSCHRTCQSQPAN